MKNIVFLVSFKLLLMFFIAYSAGLLVKYKHVRVNYTRKINHFFLFFIPAFIDHYFLKSENISIALINQALFVFASFIIFVKPLRTKIKIIATAFSSFDRPEDRPYTLLWYMSQVIVGYLVLIWVIVLYDHHHMLPVLNIVILIGVFGDGLAEPIGIKFGKHKYTTPAIFRQKKYVRTLEGSSVIFITSIIIVSIFSHAFNHTQFLIALATIPIAMTLAEAFSPHTWDDPLMITVGSLLIFWIKTFF